MADTCLAMNKKVVVLSLLTTLLWARETSAAPGESAPETPDTTAPIEADSKVGAESPKVDAESPEGDPEASSAETSVAATGSAPATVDTNSSAEDPAPAPAETTAVEAPTVPDPVPAESDEEKKKNLPTFVPGVQAFLRGEGRINPDFNSGGGAVDQAAVRGRIRLQLLASWGPVSAFAQFQDARSWGFEGSTTSNEANTDLHQGWMQLEGKKDKMSGYVRLGRQELNVGNQRLIGSLLWLPGARAFDAIMLHGEFGRFKLDVFGAMLQLPGTVNAPDPMDPVAPPLTANTAGNQLVGLVFGADIHKAINAEFVGLYDRADARNNALGFERNIVNTGLRVFGEPIDGLKYDAEGNLQFGNNQTRKHLAWAWVARVDYLYKKFKVKPGAHLSYAMASGESCTGDPSAAEACGAADSTEFFNFYPTNHLHYGFVDLFGWRNMRDLEAGVMMAVPSMLKKLEVKYHFFQLNSPDGRWSNVGGANVGAGWDPTNTDRNLGHEVDVFAVFKPWKFLFVQPGYGVFIPTGAGKTLAGNSAQHFLWLWIVMTF